MCLAKEKIVDCGFHIIFKNVSGVVWELLGLPDLFRCNLSKSGECQQRLACI